MAQFEAKTISAEQVWQSDDGQVTAFEVVLSANGKQLKTQTYSKLIAKEGWSGTVDTYEKNGRTFVKQPQREGGRGGYQGAKSKGSDDNRHTMYLSYAKDIAVALIGAGKMTQDAFDKAVEMISTGGRKLYNERPDGEQSVEQPKEQTVDIEELGGDPFDN